MVLPSSKRAADVILVAACVLQLLSIRDGQPWGDDFAHTHCRTGTSGGKTCSASSDAHRANDVPPAGSTTGCPL